MYSLNRKLSCFLVLLMSLGIIFMRLIPSDTSQALKLLSAPENCLDLCFMGIYPGISTVGEAMLQLQDHAWVGNSELSAPGYGYAQIEWTWSNQHPDLIDDSYKGRMTFYYDDKNAPALADSLIQTITIYTKIRMFDLQDWYGSPNFGMASVQSDNNLIYSAAYNVNNGMIGVSTLMPCPVNLMSYWNAPARIVFSIGHGSSDFILPPEMVKLC